MERYAKSQQYLERALKVTPGGAQTLSKRAGRFPIGAYPVAITRGVGLYVWDVDGHRYLDFICGLACMTLGYLREEVHAATQKQLQEGVSFSLAHPLEAEVAEKICAMIPCAEMVRFVKTGSESTEAAIRVARKATGRDMILCVGDGYNSWHSWMQCLKDSHPGIPDAYRYMAQSFKYNDLEELQWKFTVHRNNIAAVILEPCLNEKPVEGFLQGIRDLCTKYGAVLIFDEMVTGYRWANGGAQEYFGVTPDLATFGKACANGFPLAFLCGKRELMEHADVVSGTFGGETLSLAACSAVMDIYQHEPIIDTLWARGQQLQDGFNDLAQVLNVPVVCDGYPVKPRIRFTCPGDSSMPMSLFLQETALRGILWHPAGGNISAAMTKVDIETALIGMGESLAVVKTALESGNWTVLHGLPIQHTPFVRKA